MLKKWIFLICAIVILGVGVRSYEYYWGGSGGVVEIEKVFSSNLLIEIRNANPQIESITTEGQITILKCGSLSEYQCRKLGKKLEEIVTKLCLDRNGIVSVEVNAQGNIVRTIGDTSCLQ